MLNLDDFAISSDQEGKFEKNYASISNKFWYPKNQFADAYTLFIKKATGSFKNRFPIGSSHFEYYLDWKKFILKTNSICSFENINIKMSDLSSPTNYSNFSIPKKQVLSEEDEALHKSIILAHTIGAEEGNFIFADSGCWGVFYGEILYENQTKSYKDIEFDIFAIKTIFEDKFIKILRESIREKLVFNNMKIFVYSVMTELQTECMK